MLKFIGVGLSGVIVNEGILWLLTEFGGLRYYVSSLVGIEASIISNFILNDYFTFADRRTGKTRSFISRLLKFNVTCAAGAGIQYGLLLLLTSVVGINYLLSNLIGILVAFIWNYIFKFGLDVEIKNILSRIYKWEYLLAVCDCDHHSGDALQHY